MGQTTSIIKTSIGSKGRPEKKKPTSAQNTSDTKWTKKANNRMEEYGCSTYY